jgi:phage-related protein
MPAIGPACHELRVNDVDKTWRIMFRIDSDAVVILEVFEKKTQQTSESILKTCRQRLKAYDAMR